MPQKIILYIRKVTSICILVGAMVLGLSSPEVSAKPKSSIADSLQVLHFQIGEVEFDMQRVDGGVFIMGGTKEQHREVIATDLPTHTVSLDAYYIGTTEVTQALWKAVMPEWYVSDEWNTPTLPMTDVNWYDCQEFIRRLDSITGMPFRLPTEAEWEFAARGGNQSKGYRYSGSDDPYEVAWFDWNSREGFFNLTTGFAESQIHPVRSKKPNELGIYDMSGNASEVCSDWYGIYPYEAVVDPQGRKYVNDENRKVDRGGWAHWGDGELRVTDRRQRDWADERAKGFRIAF